MDATQPDRIARVAAEALAVLGTGRQLQPFSQREPDFDLAEAYDVALRVRDLRVARGENPVGRKIGFTNRAIWSGYGISGPIWNYMFDRTVADLAVMGGTFVLPTHPEPRIEPEVVLHLAAPPRAGMSEDELFGCIDWIAPGFEIVHSIFPDWSFAAADAVAAYGVHSALLLGTPRSLAERRSDWAEALAHFGVDLVDGGDVSRSGRAENVLGGPVKALRFLVEELARYPRTESLRAGEIITTGTLTEAMPVAAGQTWTARFSGIDFAPLQLAFT